MGKILAGVNKSDPAAAVDGRERGVVRQMLPAGVGPDGVLPAGIYQASIGELRAHFGAAAVPAHGDRREMILDALDLYARMIRAHFSNPTIWVNGGFVTRKLWAAPDDADVVTLIDPAQALGNFLDNVKLLVTAVADRLSVTASGGRAIPFAAGVQMKPMGGLIDAYMGADLPAIRAYWQRWFSNVRLPDGSISAGDTKGFVELI